MYSAIKHFRHFLEGRQFHVLTDHRPLTFALNTYSDSHSPRQVRQLGYISQFTSTIVHIKEADNVVADAVLRVHTNTLLLGKPLTVDFAAMAEAQSATDPQIRSLRSSSTTTLVVEAISLANSHNPLYCDTSMGMHRPVVSLTWCRIVLDSLHAYPTQEFGLLRIS